MQPETDEATNLVEKSEIVSDLLESLAGAIEQVLPVEVEVRQYKPLGRAVFQTEISVLVGFTGDIYGRILIQGSDAAFGKLCESMYGAFLEGEMLHSFIGELANMIAGNASIIMCTKQRHMDITPPTVLMGQNHLYGLDNGVMIPVNMDRVGDMQIIVSLRNKGAA